MEDRLQKFARLVEIGNFTRASRELHISQPALSMAIDKLEQELGSELIIRGGRRFELTEAGRAAYEAALEHQNVSDHLRNNLNRITKKRPAVTIGMTDSVAATLCTTSAFDELERAADVTIVVNNSRYLRDAVEQRRVDMAFIIDDESEIPYFARKAVGIEELLLVCGPGLQTKTEEDLAKGSLEGFICYDKPSVTYRHIQQTLQAKGIKAHTKLFSTSPDVMLGMVLRGRGVATLPRMLVDTHLQSKELVIPQPQLVIRRPITSISLRGKALPACLRQFRAACRL